MKVFSIKQSHVDGIIEAEPIGHMQSASITKELLAADRHNDETITTVKKYLSDNISRPLSIELIGMEVNMSPRNLTRVFKKKSGYTIWQYLTKLRIQKARNLLAETSYTVDFVAAQCGFKSRRQLHRILNISERLKPLKEPELTMGKTIDNCTRLHNYNEINPRAFSIS